jgi:membrane-associated protease RseP (regulator of RpoE activity)
MEGGCAQSHGIRVGDIILHVNGSPVSSNAELTRQLSKSNEKTIIMLNRSGQDIELALPSGKLGLVAEEELIDVSELRKRYEADTLAKSVVVATMDFVEGRHLEGVVGVVSAEYAVGMNLIKDILVGGRDLFGGAQQGCSGRLS